MLFIEATALEVAIIVVTSIIGIFCLSAALEGFMFRKMKFYEIIPLIIGSIMLIYPDTLVSGIGLAVVAVIIVIQLLERRHDKKLSINQ